MATTLTYGAVTITLPDYLLWTDEYAWRAVGQKKSYGVTGALHLQAALKLKGRPITLAGEDGAGAFMARSVVELLRVASELPGQVFTLLLRSVAHQVHFDHEAGGLDAKQVFGEALPIDTDQYLVSLRFIKV